MASLGTSIDPNTIEPETEGYICVPDGRYNLVILDSELKETSSGADMLILKMQFVDGKHKGEMARTNLNLFNANPTAKDIAWRQLGGIAKAVGITYAFTDSSVLHDKPFSAKAKVQAGQPNGKGGMYPDSNNWNTFKPVEPVKAGQAATPQASGQGQSQPHPNAPQQNGFDTRDERPEPPHRDMPFS